MADQNLSLSVLNIVAHPHPKGVYISLLEMAAGSGVKFWGSDYAAVSPPVKVDEQCHQGRVAIWTQIDTDEPAIDLRRLEEISLEEMRIELPRDVGFNGRIFLYTLTESNHRLYVETKNEFGKRLSPKRAQRIFSALLSPERLPPDAPLVDVTVVPEDDSVERLLGIHRLDVVEIHLRRPNPEEFGDLVQQVLDELQEEGLKSEDVILRRAPDSPTINLSERHRLIAEVSATNGYLATSGREEDGEKFDGSTREYPKIIQIAVDRASSLAVVAREIAKSLL